MNKVTPMVGDKVFGIVTDYTGKEVWIKQLKVNLVRGTVDMIEPPSYCHKDGYIYHSELRQPDGGRYVLKSYKMSYPKQEDDDEVR